MVNEPAENSCLQRVETVGFTNPSQQWCTRSWGFHTVWAGIVRRDNCFVPDRLEMLMYGRGFVPGMGSYTPQVPVASQTAANHQLASEVEVSTSCKAASTQRITVFVAGLLELQKYGRIHNPGMRPDLILLGWRCRCMEGICSWDWIAYSPSSGGFTNFSQSPISR